ncbi:Holliday junction resolvase RuvX [Candidatus Shapirobacteria bacterium]|nr:Holliday junction resolvase RuvX [Candidatus Shapirobacteria bacterium]
MRILGIDFGASKIGLAIGENGLVEPLGIIQFSHYQSRIKDICQREGIKKIVVGISEGKSGQEAEKFAKRLAKTVGSPVETTDETLTTYEATAKMKQAGRKWRGKEDALAAALILDNYFSLRHV